MKRTVATGKKIRVNFFQRRPHTGFSFSIEQIFEDIRARLINRIEAHTCLCSYYNTGYLSKLLNILQAAYKQDKDVNHITGEVHFLDFFMEKKRVVLTIHDCGMVHRKEGIAKKVITWLYLTAPVNKAQFVTANSETTKAEIVKYTGCNPDKIEVIPVAVDDLYQPFPKIFNKDCPVILQIGTAYNKNLERLIVALNGIKCQLNIVGKLTTDQLQLLQTNNIIYKNEYNISKEQMLEQYKACDILAFVSTFEGFGMPIIEANAVERVVVTSAISSMPEVANDAACLVNPNDIADIKNGILKVINDSVYREKLIANGIVNKLRFKADNIADQYYEIYKKIITI